METTLVKQGDGTYRLGIGDVELIITKQELVDLTGGLYQLVWHELGGE